MSGQTNRILAFVYYLFAFMLLWEWLRPLQEFTDTGNTFIFVFFIGTSFMLIFLKARWFVSYPVKILLILFVLHGLYYEGVFFNFIWLSDFSQDIIYNVSLIPLADWMGMTSSFRSALFFLLLWLLVYLIHYWVLFQKKILFFFILTLLYITILDTFTPYNATTAIIRTVLVGFFMLGLLYLDRLSITERLKVNRISIFKWILPLFTFIFASICMAMLAPKAAPQWPDPVPYITAIGSGEGGEGMKKIGYSQNDKALGGGFVGDDTEVFRHISSEQHYWRVETKDIYTGKGWEISNSEAELIELEDLQQMGWTDSRVETKKLTSKIIINSDYRHFHAMYPLGLTSIETENNLAFYINPTTEIITPFKETEGSRDLFAEFEVEYELPVYPLNEMKKVQDHASLPTGFIERYTQLPDKLPERINELANQLTFREENQFDKVKAIEEYLGNSDFTYDKQDVAIPKGNQDYVDQFLFETMKGYCDNFSTSMIVLLRSINIPARWVKGYTEGEFVNSVPNLKSEYRVTNNNAHSWVEVYFTGVGWVPFEPTKGFVNPYELTTDYKTTTEQMEDNSQQNDNLKKQEPVEKPIIPQQEEDEAPTAEQKELNLFNFRFGSFALYGVLLVVLLLLIVAYKKRVKWYSAILLYKFKNRTDEDVFFQAYESLLIQLKRYGIDRRKSQTLRDYAIEIDSKFQVEDMTALTKSYERALYRRANAKEEWASSIKLWENLIKRTSS